MNQEKKNYFNELKRNYKKKKVFLFNKFSFFFLYISE
jgi:hypothetical protein